MEGLSPKSKAYVDAKIRSGEYPDEEAVLVAAIEALQRQEALEGERAFYENLEKAGVPLPSLAKVHSQRHADEYLRFGWTLKHEFRVPGDDEPYEYVFEWLAQGDPVRPSADPKDWGISAPEKPE